MFASRVEAGRQLGEAIARLDLGATVVLGLPRGGIAVAAAVAERLGAPLGVLAVRKIGHPASPEFGIGAVAYDGVMLLDPFETGHVDAAWLDQAAQRERAEAERIQTRLQGNRAAVSVAGKAVVLVDDGIATGWTVRAALHSVLARGPARVVVAAPVAAEGTARQIEAEGATVVALVRPAAGFAVGQFYRDFRQVSEDEAAELLGA